MNAIFIASLSGLLVIILSWGFRKLHREGWQFLAVLPRGRRDEGTWEGLNITWYGLFNALGAMMGAAVLIVLMGSVGAPTRTVFLLIGLLLPLGVLAGKWVARLVEGRTTTSTSAGAFFVITLLAPWAVLTANRMFAAPPSLDVTTFLAGAFTAFALGESLGRLACLSFGCCYGRPVRDCPPLVRKLLGRWPVRYEGLTRKASYEAGFQNESLVPIQPITSIVSGSIGLAGTALFLSGRFRIAAVGVLVALQVWRWISEFLRADDRGGGTLSKYQIMAALNVVYLAILLPIFPSAPVRIPEVVDGLRLLWHPGMLLFILGLGAFVLRFTGFSQVTASQVTFHLVHDRV
jgi:putative Ca2+/H+ antiporter (TMEM165/GDT1 family)